MKDSADESDDEDSFAESFHMDDEDVDDDDEQVVKGQSEKTAAALKINPQHFQVMKASFFGDEDDDYAEMQLGKENRLPPLFPTGKSPGFVPWKQTTSSVQRLVQSPIPLGATLSPASSLLSVQRMDVSSRPPRGIPQQSSRSFRAHAATLTREKRVITPVPWEESFFRKFHDPASESGRQCLIKDTTAFMGRSFRVGWGPNGILAHLGSSLAPTATTKKSSDADMSFTIFGPKSSTGAASLRHSPYYTVTLERVVISPTMIPASPNIEV